MSHPFAEAEVSILYRDHYLLAVQKPAGMIVHRGWAKDQLTVADVVRDKIIGGPVYAVHRLDRGTSGVLLFALNAGAAFLLQTALHDDSARKRYLALVRGPMKEGCLLDHAIPRSKGGVRVPAITEFHPIAHSDRWSLVSATPRTGRLHQIRRHLKHISHPIVGDVRYGKGPINRLFRETYGLNRLALHAFEITFRHPQGDMLCIQAPLPSELEKPLLELGLWPLPVDHNF